LRSTVKKIIVKIVKIIGITIGSVLLLMFLIPMAFPDEITQRIKAFANEKINGELNFSKANLSFFHHFPSLTLTLNDFYLKGSAPYKKDTLVSAKDITFGINVRQLVLDKKVHIDQIFVDRASINVKVNSRGEANYNVYNSSSKSTDTSSTALRLAKIEIKNTHIKYDDRASKFFIDAKGFNYIGDGNLDKAIFDLNTKMDIEKFNLDFGGETYLRNKKVNANLITKINTNSLAFLFKQNNLLINKLPIDFIGKFDFLKNGYDIDFTVKSEKSELNDFFTALPPQYVTWLEKSKVQGMTDVVMTLKGQYIAATNTKPDLGFGMKIRNGFISYKNAPIPASNIYLDLTTTLPSLDVNKLKVNLDSLFLNVGTDYLSAKVDLLGLTSPTVDAKIQSFIDLGKLNKAIGLKSIDARGLLKMDLLAKGKYDLSSKKLPITNADISFTNGLIKTQYYPHPISNIQLKADVKNKAGNLKSLQLKIFPGSFVFEGKPFTVTAYMENFEDILYDIKAKGELDIAKIYKVFSKKGLDLNGFIKANVSVQGRQSDATNGRYNKLKNKGSFTLRNIKTRSEFLPKAFVIKEGVFTFNQDKLQFNNFKATYGQSDLRMSGYMQNAINFIMTKNAILKGSFAVNANYINVDEFMTTTTSSKSKIPSQKTKTNNGIVIIPSNFDLKLNAVANKINFEGLTLDHLKGDLTINKAKINLQNTTFNIIGSSVTIDAMYGSINPRNAIFDFHMITKEFDIKRAYKEVKLFREMVSAGENAEGIIFLDYSVKGNLNQNMLPIYPSLLGGGTVSIKGVKMKGYKVFNAVSQKTSSDAMKDPSLSDVVIKTAIKNNIITIDRFKLKVAGFRPRIEGTTSFDGQLNIKFRLGLPPLGIIGIPLTITGNKDKPKIRLGNKTEDIPETEFKQDSVVVKK
jgi:AsmA protein